MLAKSPVAAKYGDPAEEFAIQDHEGLGPVDEHEQIGNVVKFAAGMVERGAAFLAFLHVVDVDEADKFDEAFAGEWDSEDAYYEDVAESHVAEFKSQLADQPGQYPSIGSQFESAIESAIDMVRLGRDLDGFDVRFSRVGDQLFAFRGHL